MSQPVPPTLLPSGGRRVARPTRVVPCPACGAPTGKNYPDCPACYQAIEPLWMADWEALLAQEQIQAGSHDEQLLAQVVVAEVTELERHPWTVIDIAMKLVRCAVCDSELGGGPPSCEQCEFAFGNLWAYDMAAGFQGQMTANEHALRVGRWVLRYPHRQRGPDIVTAWRNTYPRVLTGWLPTTPEAQRGMALVRAGKMDEVEAWLRVVDAEILAASQHRAREAQE